MGGFDDPPPLPPARGGFEVLLRKISKIEPLIDAIWRISLKLFQNREQKFHRSNNLFLYVHSYLPPLILLQEILERW